MASIVEVPRTRKGTRRRGGRSTGALVAYKVRYRDPDRRERSKTFLRKIDAEEFARSVETDISRGAYLDPAAGKVTLESWAEEWFIRRSASVTPRMVSSSPPITLTAVCHPPFDHTLSAWPVAATATIVRTSKGMDQLRGPTLFLLLTDRACIARSCLERSETE